MGEMRRKSRKIEKLEKENIQSWSASRYLYLFDYFDFFVPSSLLCAFIISHYLNTVIDILLSLSTFSSFVLTFWICYIVMEHFSFSSCLSRCLSALYFCSFDILPKIAFYSFYNFTTFSEVWIDASSSNCGVSCQFSSLVCLGSAVVKRSPGKQESVGPISEETFALHCQNFFSVLLRIILRNH